MTHWAPRIGRVFAVLLLAGAVAVAGCSEGTAPAGPAASERLATEQPGAVVALAPPSDGAANVPSSATATEIAVPRPPSGVAPAAVTWTVVAIVDGDTLDVRSSEGVEERIRVIGIDTPEKGECGFAAAADALSRLVLNQRVVLVAGARDDRDRYGRLLRYVDVGVGRRRTGADSGRSSNCEVRQPGWLRSASPRSHLHRGRRSDPTIVCGERSGACRPWLAAINADRARPADPGVQELRGP